MQGVERNIGGHDDGADRSRNTPTAANHNHRGSRVVEVRILTRATANYRSKPMLGCEWCECDCVAGGSVSQNSTNGEKHQLPVELRHKLS